MLTFEFTYVENGTADSIIFDASINESHRSSATLTKYPVEGGLGADGAQNNPDDLSITAIISDHPLQTSAARANRIDNAAQTYAKLRDLKTRGVVVSVETGLRRYPNMVITSLDVPRNKDIKGAVRVSMVLSEVVIAASTTVDVTKPKARENKGRGKNDTGPQTTTPATEKQQSLARSIFGGG